MTRINGFSRERRALLLSAATLVPAAFVGVRAGATPPVPAPNNAALGGRLRLDTGWRFRLGDDRRWAAPNLDDRGWRQLQVPHDFSIEGAIAEDNPGGAASGFYPGGVGWYRLHLDTRAAWRGRRVLLMLDGVMMRSTVFVNGVEVGANPYGYLGTTVDITAHVDLDRPMLIAVRADNDRQPSSRWYTGSGIYRDVWLDVRDPLHLVPDGSWLRTASMSGGSASVIAAHELRNQGAASCIAHVETVLIDADGATAGRTARALAVPVGQTVAIELPFAVASPRPWSIDAPHRYRLQTTVSVADKICDRQTIVAGIRTIAASAGHGFLLNDRPIVLRGVCLHHDGGPVGAAVPTDLWRSRLTELKAMGANAVRCAHNPFAPEFYDLADELGLMVMDEAFDGWAAPKAAFDYGLVFDERWRTDLSKFIRRSRAHPSVVLYSIGNEVAGATREMQAQLVAHVRALDPTRPVTQGDGYRYGADDIAGFNGPGEYVGAIEDYHRAHPTRPIIGTEITHTLHTRGVYRSKTEYRTRDNPAPWELAREDRTHIEQWNAMKDRVWPVPDLTPAEAWPGEPLVYASSFDNNLVRMPIRAQVQLAERLPYLLGTFRWTGYDYLGESYAWPARTANFGVLDLAGFRKDPFYLYQSLWSAEPMVFASPHWTHPGYERVPLPVVVYTNLPEAELFLNGRSLGRKSMGEAMQIEWVVPYEPGVLSVVAHGANGLRREFEQRTVGLAAAISLQSDRATMPADSHSLARIEIAIADARGTLNPHADDRVALEIAGPARLIGLENGDILDHQSVKDQDRKAFKGRLVAYVQSTRDAGAVVVRATGAGLNPAQLLLTTA